MNKSQIVLSAIGGTVVLGALVLGYFIWDAASAKAEKAESLDSAVTSAAGVVRKLPVKPAKAELKVYDDSCEAYGLWRADAAKLAARGDLVFDKVTPAELKTDMVAEARKLAELPGCLDGKLVKPDFGFGFTDYVTGGALPPDDPVRLKRLQREWNDVASVLRTIAECGGADAAILDVRLGTEKKAEASAESADEGKKSKKNKKAKKAKAKVETAEAGGGEGPAVTAFTVDYMVRPAGFVKAVNAFSTGTRFIVVENCTFVRESDVLAEKLGGDAKKTEQTPNRRRRRGQQAHEEAVPDAKGGVIIDPATAPRLKVTMAFSVHDFGSLEEKEGQTEKTGGEATEAKTEGGKK